VGWIYSGQFRAQELPAEGTDMAMVQATEKKPENIARVSTRISIATDHPRNLVLFGRTEASRMVDVKVETAGRIVALPVKKGSTVKKGQVIARLAMDDRQARLAESKALVNQYAIAYKAAQQLSQKQYRSKVKLAESAALLEMAKARLKSMTTDINRTVIRAPFAGILEIQPVEVGDYAAVGHTVAKIVDLDPLLVVGEVTERAVKLLQTGTPAVARTLDGRPLNGIVSYISKVASDSTRTFRVEVSVSNPDGAIAAGLTAQMSLSLGTARAHFITPAVLTLSSDGVLGVKVIDEDGIVRFHTGSIVEDTPEGLWVEGLPDRIQLITVGQEFVRTGQKAVGIEAAKGQNQS
ncbi:MAG TPA: efflux RND transporter periplasmic adaptor subunit, partial [Rhodospirillales bacterium]|nr:efflux RND transporter periplasmic adaptor subunit [Rhodospirillales bacterium]